jgi:hypothetical protein
MTLATLADVQAFLTRYSPKAFRDRPHWLAVAQDMEVAAREGDPADASMAIRFALVVEGVACRTK